MAKNNKAKEKPKKTFKQYWQKIRFQYKLSFFNENTLGEVWSLRLSILKVAGMLSLFALLLVTITSILIIFTPIRNFLPGYLDVAVRKEIVQNALRTDSLEQMLHHQSVYLENIVGILTGTATTDSINEADSLFYSTGNYDIARGKNESAFVATFEEEERYNLSNLNAHPVTTEGLFFYRPVKGIISASFSLNERHYGIDLVASTRESVLATLPGTVVFTGHDPDFGNVIQIQHLNGYLSVYKHNELLLKELGDRVRAGEAIALIGNTGKLSTGPHLHFELWFKGQPVNPADYIAL